MTHPYLEDHPRLARMRFYQSTLAAGDVLYIPAMWVHSFRHLDRFNVATSNWLSTTDVRASPVWRRHMMLESLMRERNLAPYPEGPANSMELYQLLLHEDPEELNRLREREFKILSE